ncbi:MAG: hypothetical protein Q4C65_02380 [Eubacteriales bacterium]|nr:hypothetical protein [Eubacteriales bacterium]
MRCDRSLVGGNWNDDVLAGAFAVKLNNTPSNANTNYGASSLIKNSHNAAHIPHRLVEINSMQASAGSL